MNHQHMNDAIRARQMLADSPEDRKGVYPNRANRQELLARAAVYPVGHLGTVVPLRRRPPEPPEAA